MTKTIPVHVEPNDEMLDHIEREGCIRWANGELDDITALVALARKGLKPIPADDREEVAKAIYAARVEKLGLGLTYGGACGSDRRIAQACADAAIRTLISLGWGKK